MFKQLKDDRHHLIIIVMIFIASVVLGAYLPELQPKMAELIEKEVFKRFSEIAKIIKDAPFWVSIITIWFNNIIACFNVIITGIILMPLIILMGNGVVIGLFQGKMESMGLSASQYYLSLLPHGIFELPAFFIAVMMGVQFGIGTYKLIWKHLRGRGNESFFTEYTRKVSWYIQNKGRFYSLTIIILLTIAAILEVSVSPLILRR